MLINLTIVICIATVAISLVDSQEFEYIHCCEFPDIVSKAIQAKCPIKLNGDSKEEYLRAITCQANCLAEQLNILSGDHIDVKKFELAVNKIVGGNAEAKEFYRSTMVQCEKTVLNMEKAKKMPNVGCSFKTFGEMTCLGNALGFKCPPAKTIKSPQCEAQRKLFKGMSQQLN